VDAAIETYLGAVVSSVERIVACLEGVEGEALNWRPLPGSNSLYAIATHALANAERNVLGTFAGLPYDWRRDEEFAAAGVSAEPLRARWASLQRRMWEALDPLPASDLKGLRVHPRLGEVPGWAVLLQAARHAAEHAGEAELTRNLVDNRKK
jgi:hypothetical protein